MARKRKARAERRAWVALQKLHPRNGDVIFVTLPRAASLQTFYATFGGIDRHARRLGKRLLIVGVPPDWAIEHLTAQEIVSLRRELDRAALPAPSPVSP